MNISQPKIDLAVLWKLYLHSENGGEPLPPSELGELFSVDISDRRIELALRQLESEGLVDREYHRHYDEGLWAVSRDGLLRVERALRVPTSFIFRLDANGDSWLEGDEAQSAVLKKLNHKGNEVAPSAPEKTSETSPVGPINITNTISPTMTQDVRTPGEPDGSGRSAARAGWLNVWVALAVGIVAILVTVWVSGKL